MSRYDALGRVRQSVKVYIPSLHEDSYEFTRFLYEMDMIIGFARTESFHEGSYQSDRELRAALPIPNFIIDWFVARYWKRFFARQRKKGLQS